MRFRIIAALAPIGVSFFLTSCFLTRRQAETHLTPIRQTETSSYAEPLLGLRPLADDALWKPLVIPTQAEAQLGEADLLASASAVPPGGCKAVRRPEEGWPLWHFRSLATPAEPSALVLFTERDSRTTLAIGRFTSEGTLSCRLPREGVAATAGRGLSATVVMLTDPDQETVLPQPKYGRLRFRSAGGFRAGTVVRIGRQVQPDFFALSPNVPAADNLYFRSLTSAGRFQVDEVLTTTFLVLEDFSFVVEPGAYKIAATVPGTEPCLVDVPVDPGAEVAVSCPHADAVLPPQTIDATVFPAPLATHPLFLRFLAERHASVLSPADTASADPAVRILAPGQSPLGPFSILKTAAEKFETWDGTLQRVFSADTSVDAQALCANIARYGTPRKLIFAGTGENALASGTPPFLFTTEAALENPAAPFAQSSLLLTNGTRIVWMGHEGSKSLLSLPSQQKYRFQLRIPPGNDTRFAVLYVDGRELKRYTIPRGSVDEAALFDIDEKIEIPRDFRIGVCSWGDTFLPDLIYGPQNLTPISATRSFCVDADGNGLCQAEDRQ